LQSNIERNDYMPDFRRLEKHILDNILEAQVKLGYEGRSMSLNYTETSLKHLIGDNSSGKDLKQILSDFADYTAPRFGKLTITDIKNGFCITVPPEGTAYVNTLNDGNGFISALVEAVRQHRSLDEILAVFRRFSDSVSVTETDNDEFQYLVYFTDGIPDDYLYCLTVDEEIDGSIHVTYHRFIKEDYEDFNF